jgi:hypothetical protein
MILPTPVGKLTLVNHKRFIIKEIGGERDAMVFLPGIKE